jgi:hypothetical protein
MKKRRLNGRRFSVGAALAAIASDESFAAEAAPYKGIRG